MERSVSGTGPTSLSRFCARTVGKPHSRTLTRYGIARTGVLFSDGEEFVRICSSFRSLIVVSIYYCSISVPGVRYTPDVYVYAGFDWRKCSTANHARERTKQSWNPKPSQNANPSARVSRTISRTKHFLTPAARSSFLSSTSPPCVSLLPSHAAAPSTPSVSRRLAVALPHKRSSDRSSDVASNPRTTSPRCRQEVSVSDLFASISQTNEEDEFPTIAWNFDDE